MQSLVHEGKILECVNPYITLYIIIGVKLTYYSLIYQEKFFELRTFKFKKITGFQGV